MVHTLMPLSFVRDEPVAVEILAASEQVIVTMFPQSDPNSNGFQLYNSQGISVAQPRPRLPLRLLISHFLRPNDPMNLVIGGVAPAGQFSQVEYTVGRFVAGSYVPVVAYNIRADVGGPQAVQVSQQRISLLP